MLRGEGRTWLRRIELPDCVIQALHVLHHTHKAQSLGEVLGDGDIRAVLVPQSVAEIRKLFQNSATADTPVRALLLKDGLVLDISGREASGDVFVGDLLFNITTSRQVRRSFGAVFGVSKPAEVKLGCRDACRDKGCGVADILGAVYPAWSSIKARARDRSAARELQVMFHSGTTKADKVFALGGDDFENICLSMQGARSAPVSVNEGELKVRAVRRGGDIPEISLQYAPCQQELRYEISTGAFGTVLEHRVPGLYVHGTRSLVRDMVLASPRETWVCQTAPLHSDLAMVDNLVQAVRSMGLVTTYADCDMFRILDVSCSPAPAEPASSVSAYALSTQAQVAGLCSRECRRKLFRRGVPFQCAAAAILGAYAVAAREQKSGLVCLNTDPEMPGALGDRVRRWVADTLEQHSRQPVPLLSFEWFGREVALSHVCSGAGHSLLFSSEGAPFALSGYAYRADSSRQPPHTPFCQALARGEVPPGPVPSGEALSSLAGASLAAAARRLAVIDKLTSCYPQFSRGARMLRSVWLHSEKCRLLAAGTPNKEYCRHMCVLSQMMEMPLGENFWATVPYMPRGDPPALTPGREPA